MQDLTGILGLETLKINMKFDCLMVREGTLGFRMSEFGNPLHTQIPSKP